MSQALSAGTALEKQSAVAVLAELEHPSADKALQTLMTMLQEERLPVYLRLDVVGAAERRADDHPPLRAALKAYADQVTSDDPLAVYQNALEGGSAERGERLFTQRLSLSCVRCHQVQGQGGRVGPDLTNIGQSKSKAYLLRSLVAPSAEIAEGFETLVVVLDNGKTVSGIVQSKTEGQIVLLTPEEKTITVNVDEIDESYAGQSAMPSDLMNHLTMFDLRDMVAYLASLKGDATAPPQVAPDSAAGAHGGT